MTVLRSLLSPVPDAEVCFERRSLRTGPLDRFDRVSLALVAVVWLILVARLDALKPSMSDTWYHLGVAKQIVQQGGIPGWDSWNYAPVGRPHLYPPLLHLILAFLAKVTGNVILAGQLCAATFLPVGMLTIWYCARRLLDTRLALLALIVVLADLFHFVVMEAYIASCIVNILMPVLLVSFLARRAWWSILLMTLMYYCHIGFPHCVAAGLLLFGLKYRGYLRLALKVVGISLLFYTPWLSHVLGHLDWLAVLKEGGIPGGLLQKLMAMQAFNVVLLGLGFWGIAVAPRKQPNRMLPVYMLLGFLPILFSYGGRFQMHTMPAWAMLGATVMGPLLPATASLRRIVGVMLLPLLPLPSVGVFGGVMPIPLTASHMLVILAVTGKPLMDSERSEAYREDCEELAAWIRKNTKPEEIIHTEKVWVADMVSLLTDRATDFGAWWECSKESMRLYGRNLRDWEQRAVFVAVRPEADTKSLLLEQAGMPGVDRTLTIGRFQVGIREARKLRPAGETVPLRWEALSAAGATGSVEQSAGRVSWRFRPEEAELSLISADVPEGQWDGVGFEISASGMTGDLVLGVRLENGRDYRWPLSIAEPGVYYKVRAVLDWMTDADGKTYTGGRVAGVYFAAPPGKWGKKTEWRVEIVDLGLLVEVGRGG